MKKDEKVALLQLEYGLRAMDPSAVDIPDAVLRLVPLSLVRRHGLVPIALTESVLTVAMVDPSNLIAINEVKFLSGYDVRVVVASRSAIGAAIARHYVGQ